jgi:hypothetical protein
MLSTTEHKISKQKISKWRKPFLVLALFVAALGVGILAPQISLAHEAPCPYCDVALAQDTDTQDNETVLKIGRKKIEYRCVYCALSEAKTEYSGDLTILAPSEEKGAPIVLSRKNGQWTSDPEGAVFVAQKASHRVCHITYRAFSNKAAFETWVKKNKEYFDDNAKPLTLAQMIEVAK